MHAHEAFRPVGRGRKTGNGKGRCIGREQRFRLQDRADFRVERALGRLILGDRLDRHVDGGEVLQVRRAADQRQRLLAILVRDLSGVDLAGEIAVDRRQRALDARLRTERVADDHQPVAHDDHLVELRDLDEEELGQLQVGLLALDLAAFVERVVVGLGQLHPGEQVAGDALEERHVVLQELGQVDVDDRAQHQHVLVGVDELPLQVGRRAKQVVARLEHAEHGCDVRPD